MATLMQVTGQEEDNDCADGEAENNEKSDGGDGPSDSGGDDGDGVSYRERRDEKERARVLEGVLSALPTFSRRYGLGRAGLHVSYVNDELGSGFRHSESPNCQASQFPVFSAHGACLLGLELSVSVLVLVSVGGCGGGSGGGGCCLRACARGGASGTCAEVREREISRYPY